MHVCNDCKDVGWRLYDQVINRAIFQEYFTDAVLIIRNGESPKAM